MNQLFKFMCAQMTPHSMFTMFTYVSKSTLGQSLPFLKTLFNDVYDKGEVPADWYESIICPIYKSGSIRKPQNNRDISLMNSISKIFNGILTARVQKWAEEKNVLDELQDGFRRGFSTIDNIFPYML